MPVREPPMPVRQPPIPVRQPPMAVRQPPMPVRILGDPPTSGRQEKKLRKRVFLIFCRLQYHKKKLLWAWGRVPVLGGYVPYNYEFSSCSRRKHVN